MAHSNEPLMLHRLFKRRNDQLTVEKYKDLLKKNMKKVMDRLKHYLTLSQTMPPDGHYDDSEYFYQDDTTEDAEWYAIKIQKCFRKNIMFRFREDLLPSLRDKIVSLCLLFDWPNLNEHDDLAAIFRITLETMLQVDAILAESVSSMSSILQAVQNEVKLGEDSLTNKHDKTENLNATPWRRLRSWFDQLIRDMQKEMNLFYTGLQTIRVLNDINNDSESTHFIHTVQSLLSVTNTIDTLIKSLSDVKIYMIEWQSNVKILSVELVDLFKLINVKGTPDPNKLEKRSMNAVITIVKLARLFFNKLSKLTNSQLHPVMQMDSEQIADLFQATQQITSNLCGLYDYETLNPTTRPNPLRHSAERIMQSFRSPVTILIDFLNSNPHSQRPEFKDTRRWLWIWAAQFDIAVKQFLQAIHNQEFPRFMVDYSTYS